MPGVPPQMSGMALICQFCLRPVKPTRLSGYPSVSLKRRFAPQRVPLCLPPADPYCPTPSQRLMMSHPQGLRSLVADLPYACDVQRLPPPLRGCWYQLEADEGTEAYLADATAARPGLLVAFARGFLRRFLNVFDVNGLVGTCPMHVLSLPQLRALLGPGTGPDAVILDVGAGDGYVTDKLAALCREVHCTETSWPMARALRRRGYLCTQADLATGAAPPSGPYDVVSILNVLDRCDQPLSLLDAAHAALKDGGLLLVALVLPYVPCVYRGNVSYRPKQRLPIWSPDFEEAAAELCERVLQPRGYTVQALARCPYLSAGDEYQPIYSLDDVIVVCRKVGPPPAAGPCITGTAPNLQHPPGAECAMGNGEAGSAAGATAVGQHSALETAQGQGIGDAAEDGGPGAGENEC